MQSLVLLRVVSFLEYRHIVGSTLVPVLVVLYIRRIHLKTYIFKILFCKFAGFSDVLDWALLFALACEDKDFLDACLCDDFHLVADLVLIQLLSVDIIVAVEPTIDTIIFAIICYIKRCEQIYCIAKMQSGLIVCSLCHLIQMWKSRRGKQCLEVFHIDGSLVESPPYVHICVFFIVIIVHLL